MIMKVDGGGKEGAGWVGGWGEIVDSLVYKN